MGVEPGRGYALTLSCPDKPGIVGAVPICGIGREPRALPGPAGQDGDRGQGYLT